MEKPADSKTRMKFLLAVIFLWVSVACQNEAPQQRLTDRFEKAYFSGNFEEAGRLADSLKNVITHPALLWRMDSLMEISGRLQIDFSFTREEVIRQLNDREIEFTEEDFSRWQDENLLECRMINGERRFFRRTADNLVRVLAHRKASESPDKMRDPDSFDQFRISHIREILKNNPGKGDLVLPVDMAMQYTVSVDPSAVPAGEMVRCWMPYPRTDHPRQELQDVGFKDPENHVIAPEDAPHRTIFFEKTSGGNQPLNFKTELTIRSSAQYFNLRELDILPYDKTSVIYKTFTAEQPPHIVFDQRIRELSGEIVKDAVSPDEMVRRIYYWIDAHIPWAGAMEYCLMPSMPGYVLDYRRGDCGMVTLLFMTLARYNGIPVRWQSGWMLHPDEVNLHDWCEVYYEGIGWVPLDMSFGLMPSDDLQVREFYISGMDSYRFIVNHDIGRPLSPEKKYFRSEPWDFQRGELEWKGGNLYFDLWKYNMQVSYGEDR